MVAVQMAHRHRAHRVRVQPLGLQRHQAGGPAVHQHRLLVSGQVNARLPAAATAEGISAARQPHPQDTIVDHQPRQRTSVARECVPSAGRVAMVSADREDAVVGGTCIVAAGRTSHDRWSSSYAMPAIGSQSIPFVGMLREVHPRRLASGGRNQGFSIAASAA